MLKHHFIKWFFLVLLTVLLVLFLTEKIAIYYFFILLFVWLGITIWGSFTIQSHYFIKSFNSNKTIDANHIALTFDDGPTQYTTDVLDILEKYQQKATFFCIGKQIEKHPDIAKKIVAQGHCIGNHTYTHPIKMGFLTPKKVLHEIVAAQQIIQQTIGKIPNLFRPPFGVTNPNIANACTESRVAVIGWNIRSLDTVITSEDIILKRIVPFLQKGSIVLLHDTSQKTVNVLEQLLLIMEQNKIQSVTVDELLNIKAYKL